MKKSTGQKLSASRPISHDNSLFNELSCLIEQSKLSVVSYVNNTLTVLFWQIGSRINSHILRHKRAAYGEQIVVTLSRQLVKAHGSNFEEKNLRRMMQFATIFPMVKLSLHCHGN